MVSHVFHPAATAEKVLSIHCGECRSKTLTGLDDEHFYNATGYRKKEVLDFFNDHVRLWDMLSAIPAIELQEQWLWEEDLTDKIVAMNAPPPVR